MESYRYIGLIQSMEKAGFWIVFNRQTVTTNLTQEILNYYQEKILKT